MNPAPIWPERTGGNQAVQVRVLGERLSPRVQHQRCGNLAPEPARVLGEFRECGRCRLEQQRVDRSGIRLRERVQRIGHGEHHMEVAHRQELGAARRKPALLRQGLALRAVPVAAGVVVVAQLPAGLALCNMAAEALAATGLDRTHGALLHGHERVRFAVTRTVAREH